MTSASIKHSTAKRGRKCGSVSKESADKSKRIDATKSKIAHLQQLKRSPYVTFVHTIYLIFVCFILKEYVPLLLLMLLRGLNKTVSYSHIIYIISYNTRAIPSCIFVIAYNTIMI